MVNSLFIVKVHIAALIIMIIQIIINSDNNK